ncbi:hypothetical protein PV328_008370 [Microctonus aethiopoides]|uniref:DUF4371 domain-containing protein n=1 Tax=Microctonus aethiopoides TaxID=144406 RepID=A0AA39KR08_9HYME|nr:hypothetical protein PV328_008370 [Microctonus aethiopoides]
MYWLQASPDGDRIFCSVCQQGLVCRRSTLSNHVQSQKHIDNYTCLNGALSSIPVDVNNNGSDNFTIKMISTEIEFYSIIATNLVLPRNKCTKIVKNVLGAAATSSIADYFKKSKFSVMIDETTTIANKKVMCILVKIMKPDCKVVTECFDMIELERKNCSASALFAAFKSCFEKQNIRLSNIVSFASDNASEMIGSKDSFVTRLKEINPNLIISNCVCHSSALIASKACAKLPGVNN